jgi:hypothetical protein
MLSPRIDVAALFAAGAMMAATACATSANAEWTPETLPPNIQWAELNPRAIGFDPRQAWSICHGSKTPQRYYAPADEAVAIRATRRARRDGARLIVGAAAFVDKSAEDSDVAIYRYVGRYSRAAVDLVHVQYYEGDGWILVERTSGSTLEMAAMPLLAPNGRTFAAVSDAEDYNDHGVQIAALGRGRLAMAARLDASFPCDGVWRGSNILDFRVLTSPDVSDESTWRPAVVRRERQGWVLEVGGAARAR